MVIWRTSGWFGDVVIATSLGLFSVACVLPAATISLASNDSTVYGYGLLLWGWTDDPQGILPWLSNFVWFTSLVLLASGRSGSASVCSAIGLACASRVLLPYPGAILREAKWWWLASQSVLVVGCCISAILTSENRLNRSSRSAGGSPAD